MATKAMQLRTIDSDGRPCEGKLFEYYPLDPETDAPYAGENGTPGVVIMLRPIARDDEKRMRAAHTTKEVVKGVGLETRVDHEALNSALCCFAIVSWSGVLAANNQPAPCVDEAKLALDAVTRLDIISRARRSASIEVG